MPDVSLPPPTSEAAAHSQRLTALIVEKMRRLGGAIPFAEFMHDVLYLPGLGYYSSGTHKLGAAGDFITAPELSPLFSRCLARQCQQILTHLQDGVILELGAGSGIMATEMLKELQQLDCLPREYFILEVSAELRQRQQATLQKHVPNLLERVHWLECLPSQKLKAIVLANEVLDAMPVQRFCLEADDVLEFYVDYEHPQFVWKLCSTTNPQLRAAVEALRPQLPIGYVSEMNLALPAWIQALADSLALGIVLIIDYGFPHQEYYHPQRHQGTLMCHYRHHVHSDPLNFIGLQDITAHVNFSAVAEAALAAGLYVEGYTNQANFLLACGLPALLAAYDSRDTQTYLQLSQQAKTLVLPSEMGELFKVIALTQHIDIPLLGFVQDEKSRL
ncbi:MAG: SAM-dependent methyltransferase [Pseudomonadota bacterium]|nr:SAM-dependent methyltransferase [Pseudomonadota bacterium]